MKCSPCRRLVHRSLLAVVVVAVLLVVVVNVKIVLHVLFLVITLEVRRGVSLYFCLQK